jgi:chemotaxis signal transduction protein
VSGAVEQRLILFDVGPSAYAIPIADVIEVTENAPWAAVPGLPRHLAGVINHHGDALPVLSREALFEPTGGELAPPRNVLVLAAPGGEAGRLGLPVDRVVGLADAALGAPQGSGPVVERRPLRGRIVFVLDGRRMLSRAAALIDGVGEAGSGAR